MYRDSFFFGCGFPWIFFFSAKLWLDFSDNFFSQKFFRLFLIRTFLRTIDKKAGNSTYFCSINCWLFKNNPKIFFSWPSVHLQGLRFLFTKQNTNKAKIDQNTRVRKWSFPFVCLTRPITTSTFFCKQKKVRMNPKSPFHVHTRRKEIIYDLHFLGFYFDSKIFFPYFC